MVRIKLLDNTHGTIITDLKTMAKIRAKFSVKDESARFSYAYKTGRWDGKVSFIGKGNNFLIGLYPDIKSYCLKEFGKVSIDDCRKGEVTPDKLTTNFNGVKLRDYQREIVEASIYNKFPRGIIHAATNSGKSLMAAAITKTLIKKTPILYLVHRRELLNQIIPWFEEYLGVRVGRYDSDVTDLEHDVVVAMIPTLHARRKSPVTQELLHLSGCLLIDEAHHASSKTWSAIIKQSQAYYKFAFSGTALQSAPHRNMQLIGLTGPVLGEISGQELVDLGYSAKPQIVMLDYDKDDTLVDDIVKIKESEIKELAIKRSDMAGNLNEEMALDRKIRDLSRELYDYVYYEGVCVRRRRSRQILNVTKCCPGKSILIVVTKINHGEYLKRFLDKRSVSTTFISGGTPGEERDRVLKGFGLGKIKIVISTMIWKEGINVPAIDVLVFAAGGKAPHTVLQFLGRGLRKRKGKDEVLVFDFVDRGHKLLKKQSRERFKIYRREKYNPKTGRIIDSNIVY